MVGFEEQLCLLHILLSFFSLSGAVRILEFLTLKVDVIFVRSLFFQILYFWRIYMDINNVNQSILSVPLITFHIELVFSKGQVCTVITYSLYSSKKSFRGF